MELSDFNKNSYRFENLQTIQSVENFGAYNGLLVNFGRLGNQQNFDAMNGYQLESWK